MDCHSIKKHIFDNLAQYMPDVIVYIVYEYYGRIISSFTLNDTVSLFGDYYVGITDEYFFCISAQTMTGNLFKMNLKTHKQEKIKLENFSYCTYIPRNIKKIIKCNDEYYILFDNSNNGLLVFNSDFKWISQFSLGKINYGQNMVIQNDKIYILGYTKKEQELVLAELDIKTKTIINSIDLPKFTFVTHCLTYVNDQLEISDEYNMNVITLSDDLTNIKTRTCDMKELHAAHTLFIHNQKFITTKHNEFIDSYNSMVVCKHDYLSSPFSKAMYCNNKIYLSNYLSQLLFIFNVNYL